jgi:hypothetical protein
MGDLLIKESAYFNYQQKLILNTYKLECNNKDRKALKVISL